MKTPLLLTFVLVTSVLVACGGDPKGAHSPESGSGITETSAKEDMPPPPSSPSKEDPKDSAPTSAKPEPAAAGGVIKVAAIKLTPAKKGAHDKAVELKADGTITVDGKPAAKIKGDEVDSIEGTSMLTVGVDGSLVGNGVKPGYKFEGDDVVLESGSKLSVGEDGSVTLTRDGKPEVVGKAEGGGSAKRAALVLSVLYLTIPADKKAAGGVKPPAATKTATPPAKK